MINFSLVKLIQLSLLGTFCMSILSGCQLVKIKQNHLQSALNQKTDHILTKNKLSEATRSFLLLQNTEASQCLTEIDRCIEQLAKNDILDKDQFYSAASELYLNKAIDLQKQNQCTSVLASSFAKTTTPSQNCRDLQLSYFDKSLRYSYVYLFLSSQAPETRLFDLRQGQVRTFYNVALSQLMSKAYDRFAYAKIPEQLMLGSSLYAFDLTHYPALQNAQVTKLQSSYTLNFSGFYSINRQEGLGAEFVIIKAPQIGENHYSNNDFILDPEYKYKNQPNPNIHEARYLAVSTVAQPIQANSSVTDILSGKTAFKVEFYDPNLYKTAHVHQHDYTLTANYSVPFGLWLAENQLGSAGYWTLFNREEKLRMPHLFQLEPYQPNKKIIVMIHGLASSPETWISLTNNIMGDTKLRENYQVWQVFYSTNMPIFESRYQIDALLRQAFAQLEPNSPSTKDAVLIGHSMGGVISRLLISDADISEQAIPYMNYEQHIQLQRNPVIRNRFIFKPLQPISRAIFIAAPHHGTEFADRWFTNIAKKLVVLPQSFFNQVNIHLPHQQNSTTGLVHTGPADLSRDARFMRLTTNIMPIPLVPYHSIIGNKTKSHDPNLMSDGIVPYSSSHLEGAISEKVLNGGHSIHEKPEVILELRRILQSHLRQTTP